MIHYFEGECQMFHFFEGKCQMSDHSLLSLISLFLVSMGNMRQQTVDTRLNITYTDTAPWKDCFIRTWRILYECQY